MKKKYGPAKKTYEIEVARVETHNINNNEEMLPPYYKIYSRDEDGCLMFETECETLDEAYDYMFEIKEKEDEQDTNISS